MQRDKNPNSFTRREGDESREPVIEATGVAKTYDSWGPLGRSVEVLSDASVRVHPGEIVGIMGENGSGKSTLMGILAGVIDTDDGEIDRNGGIGWCPQEPRLYERLTVDETFRLFGAAYNMSDDAIADARDWLLDVLDFERFRDTQVRHLSGGNRQKLNLAVALMHEPDLLLLDEPYTGFDWETFLAFWELAADLRDRDIGIAIISHIVNEHDRFDVVYQLQDGCLRQRDPPESNGTLTTGRDLPTSAVTPEQTDSSAARPEPENPATSQSDTR